MRRVGDLTHIHPEHQFFSRIENLHAREIEHPGKEHAAGWIGVIQEFLSRHIGAVIVADRIFDAQDRLQLGLSSDGQIGGGRSSHSGGQLGGLHQNGGIALEL